MKIGKIFNNNAVMAKDNNNREIVLIGCGLAFKKKVGDEIDEALIEKTFTLKEKDTFEKFKMLLEDIPTEQISLCYDIIEYAKNNLKCNINDYIYVTLTDHISYTLKLFDEGIERPNVLIWEIKKLYPKEFNIGIKALEFIESETGKKLNEEEAGNIALHLITAQFNDETSRNHDIYRMTKKINDILNIVKYTYDIELDEKSLNYERFVTHLRFFFKRVYNKEFYEDESEDFILSQVKKKYTKAYRCMLKIEKYLKINLSEEEQLYLTLHIQRVTSR
ncbi:MULTISPECIES: BglG family transcription antiterminator LicT [Clostridium]|uniref:PRD domain-containing protein n=1 Tax=Clostridium butyricum TaxID=1492 RepID=A0AAP9RD41_CLOBU|nr:MULTISPECIES: PRD domain-containing protein [Clostridium]ALP90024.1 transcription antiterminator LicT [Clostridium butyricum]ALS16477.1 transcription antiterminator LicT [Clostridium butyricum]ANF13641.1 transcription antiterminator LicT [Clostridium butyricum]AOR93708.1 transcription antiterminator LicT [Clostridium butyricum]APF22440.1 CAT RNA binding domain protein [Clostridium butyricum]